MPPVAVDLQAKLASSPRKMCVSSYQKQSDRWSLPVAAAGRLRRPRRYSASPRPGACRWAMPSAFRTPLTTTTRTVRGRRGHRHQPRALGPAHPQSRPHPRHWPAPGRDDHQRLHAAAGAQTEAETHAHPCQRRRTEPGLPGRRWPSTPAWAPPPTRSQRWKCPGRACPGAPGREACHADYLANLQPSTIAALPADTERGLVDMPQVMQACWPNTCPRMRW